MSDRLHIVAILVSSGVLLFMLELLRRRVLKERQALVWLAASGVLLLFSIWDGLLGDISDLVGIKSQQNALFVMAGAFALLVLLYHSLVISKLTDRVEILARRLAHAEADGSGEPNRELEDPLRAMDPDGNERTAA